MSACLSNCAYTLACIIGKVELVKPVRCYPLSNENRDDRASRRSFILVDGYDNEERHWVSCEGFVRYAGEKPERLFEKLEAIHQRYDECFDD